ncbi:MAG: hypothetical protein Q8N04_08465 [Nitrospira sp.]|nr:hypothetical protein [Nitrospira sp.]
MRIESSKGERASNQEAENDLSRRSRLAKILNVPQGYASGFDLPAA